MLKSAKRFGSLLETIGSLIGFVWLLGPPSWQDINRGTTIALLFVLFLTAITALILSIHLYHNQNKAPYDI